jgi:hypothetical protein
VRHPETGVPTATVIHNFGRAELVDRAAVARLVGTLLDLSRRRERSADHPHGQDDLGAWNLHRLVWVADRGFASAANRTYLTGGGGHYIHAEKLRHTNTEAAAAPGRPGRYHNVADNLRVTEVRVAPGGGTDQGRVRSGSWSTATPRPRFATPRSATGSSNTCST